jgi:hypothetical protein
MRRLASWATKSPTTQKAKSIRTQGVLSPLLVRPLSEQGFEIVFGARRYRAAQRAEVATVPVRIKHLTDPEALEAQLIELSIVGKSCLCLYATWAHRLYVIDVPGLPQIAGYNGNAAAQCNEMQSLIAASEPAASEQEFHVAGFLSEGQPTNTLKGEWLGSKVSLLHFAAQLA